MGSNKPRRSVLRPSLLKSLCGADDLDDIWPAFEEYEIQYAE